MNACSPYHAFIDRRQLDINASDLKTDFKKFQMCVALTEDGGGNMEADQYQQVTDQSVTHNEHSRM